MEKIITSLWMDNWIEEAVNFYVSLFKDSKVTDQTRYGEGAPGMAGKVLTMSFELAGRPFLAINGGPGYPFTEAISLTINCEDQAEVDRYWNTLTANGGSEGPCGWCKDRFGLSWQVVPKGMDKLVTGPDKAGAGRAMQAMMQMKKLDLATIQKAYAG